MSEVTRRLEAAEELLPLVYEELRRLAHVKVAQLPPGRTRLRTSGASGENLL